MLIIKYGKYGKCIRKVSKYFDYEYEPEWITKERSIKMIKDIDKSEVIGNNNILSPIFGSMSPTMLSGGVKTLILLDNTENKIFHGNAMGNNCAKWVLEIAKEKDVTITLSYYMDFEPYLKDGKFDCEINIDYNSGEFIKRIYTIDEYKDMFLEYGERYI